MNLDALEADLAASPVAADPDRWALAAYRLAVARIETAAEPGAIGEPLALLDKAGRILTADRAPIEHARILTAAANGHRAQGSAARARSLFEQAAGLLRGRVGTAEQAASLVNVGLARTECCDPGGAIAALDEALTLVPADPDDETRRILGAALLNRAQANQIAGTTAGMDAAEADYRAAEAMFDPASPQAAMAAHGRGTVLLERHRQRPTGAGAGTSAGTGTGAGTATAAAIGAGTGTGGGGDLGEALAALERALSVLGPTDYPFQHAIARHSLAVAYESRDGDGDLARALDSVEAALAVFDPRLHRPQWETATATLGRIEGALSARRGPASRIEHVVELLASTSDAERQRLLRDRLRRLAPLPAIRVDADLDALARALAALGPDHYRTVAESLLSVLMELPDPVLESACRALCLAHRSSGRQQDLDRALDETIHDLLFGPQRVRVRDLLEAHGWVRP